MRVRNSRQEEENYERNTEELGERLLNLCSWSPNAMLLSEKGRKMVVMVGDSQLLGASTAQTSRP